MSLENRAHAIAAGVFILTMGLVLVAVVAWFQSDRTERVRYTIATHAAVSGLEAKASVKLRGVEIGKVETIGFDPSNDQQILVTISVDKAAPLTSGTYAKLGLQGVTGLAYVDLEDSGKDERRLPASGAAPIELKASALDKVMDAAPDLVEGFAQSARRLNTLLSDPNQAEAARTLVSVRVASQDLAKVVAALQTSVDAMPAVLRHSDETVRHADLLLSRAIILTDAISSRADVLDRLGDAAGQIETTTRNFDTSVIGNRPARTQPFLEELTGASRALERTALDLREHPQSILFGREVQKPGPGEVGFEARQGHP